MNNYWSTRYFKTPCTIKFFISWISPEILKNSNFYDWENLVTIKQFFFYPRSLRTLSLWRATFSVGVGIFLIDERYINWLVHVRSAALLLLLLAALLLLPHLFWRLPNLPYKGENKNDLSSKPGLLIDIPSLISNDRIE